MNLERLIQLKITPAHIMTDPFPPLQVPWGRSGTHVGALLTVCIEVLPDLQELGRGQLGQVQVRWLLLWASHGEPLRDLRQHRALPARRLRSRHSPGSARHAAFIYNPEAAPAPCSQQRARVLRESACVSDFYWIVLLGARLKICNCHFCRS